ncbi:MAG: dihydropteroate synthase [Synergistaceae bacterium]|nr:dihydropteroate synthase [Synergistaceae bacterium]
MNLYPLNINSHDDMKKICARIKTDPRALAYLIPKRKILHFYADNIDYRAAAFMKQEMLSRGGDTIVTKHVIDGKTDTSDILIMGTPSQIKSMIHKMNAMPIWGLDELRRKLSDAFTNMNINEWIMTSPNGHEINLSDDTKIMAIMNLTPDSFYEPSRINENEILSRAEKFLSEGAYVLDIGAESTRPGAVPVDGSEELSRLIPALKILRREFPNALISVDTYKPNAARIAVNEGADMINDISGFEFTDGMPDVIRDMRVPYVLSHTKDKPVNMAMKEDADNNNIISELTEYFSRKINILDDLRDYVIIDPGLGFGKSANENFALIRDIESMKIFGRPVLVGHSRKRFTGSDSIAGTLAVSALLSGRVSMLRVHDVSENVHALRIAKAACYGLRL